MKILRLFLAVLSCITLLSGTISAHAQEMISDTQAGYTFTLPKGWQLIDAPAINSPRANGPRLAGKIAVNAPYKGVRPNINVVAEEFTGTLNSYAKVNIHYALISVVHAQLVSETPFATQTGAPGKRFIFTSLENDLPLRHVAYVIHGGPGYMLTITLTTHQDQGNVYDKAVGAAVRQTVIAPQATITGH